jgi:DNA-binding transcriptional ArsR family regulator
MEVFAALADPTRLRIFELIAHGEKTVGQIADNFSFSTPAISQHLKVLREAGLVLTRAEAQRRYYAVNRQKLQDIEHWTKAITEQWNTDLDALEGVLYDEQQRRSHDVKKR